MQKRPQISILIPIYNTEKYLPQCLNSLIQQTMQNIEIICINDGSMDESLNIIKEFKKKDARIKLIDKQNTGYGDSMNQGLKVARGEYIGILEPDDWIEKFAYERLYKVAKKFNAEVVKSHYFHYQNNQNTVHSIARKDQTGRLSDPAIEPFIFLEAPAIWSAIYKKSFLEKNQINFLTTPGASYQDTSFNFKVLATTHRIVYLDDNFVHYRLDNENSSVNQSDKIDFVIKEYYEIERYLIQNKLIFNLGGLMEWVKLKTYFWNLQRLAPEFMPEFIRKIRQDFKEAQKQGFLQKVYFNKKERIAYNIIMYCPIKITVQSIRLRKKMRGK